MTREDIKTITDIVHKTIYGFFDICGDDEETPITDKDKLLLSINKAICSNIRALEQKPCGDAIDRSKAIYIASGYCHFSNIPKELAKLPPVTPEPKTDVLDKIKGYIDYIRNTGMGKNKSLEFIEKFIEGLKAESEGKE